MEAENDYFIVGGTDLTRFEQFLTKREAAQAEAAKLEARFGGQAAYKRSRLAGFTIKGGCPDGWRKVGDIEGAPIYFPLRKTKEGKALASELSKFVLPGAPELHYEFFGTSFGINTGGFTFRTMSSEPVGDVQIFIMPKGHKFKPDGSRQIPTSEYWRMKEAVAAAAQGDAA